MPFSSTPSDSYDQSALQAVQLEDGTTAYIHHAVQVPQSDTILAIQADGTVAGLHTGDAAIDPIPSVLWNSTQQRYSILRCQEHPR